MGNVWRTCLFVALGALSVAFRKPLHVSMFEVLKGESHLCRPAAPASVKEYVASGTCLNPQHCCAAQVKSSSLH